MGLRTTFVPFTEKVTCKGIRDYIDGTHWNFKAGERTLVGDNNSTKVEPEHGKFNAVIITLVLCLCQHRSLYW